MEIWLFHMGFGVVSSFSVARMFSLIPFCGLLLFMLSFLPVRIPHFNNCKNEKYNHQYAGDGQAYYGQDFSYADSMLFNSAAVFLIQLDFHRILRQR